MKKNIAIIAAIGHISAGGYLGANQFAESSAEKRVEAWAAKFKKLADTHKKFSKRCTRCFSLIE